MTATLTIGLPVYNGELYLEQSVASLLDQTFTDFRLIISDNGSSDRTPAIMRQLAERDRRIEARFSPVNRGAAWNYNSLALDVDSPLFKWAAHDDLHHPEYLARCVEAIGSEPDAVAAHCRSRYISDTGEEIARSFRREHFADTLASERMGGVLTSHHDHTFAFSVMRTAALQDIRPFVPGFAADGIMLCELALRGRMIQLPQHLFANRLHPRRSVAEHGGRAGKLSYQTWWGGDGHEVDRAPTWAAAERLWSAVALSPVSGADRRRCFAVVAAWAATRWRAMGVESPVRARTGVARRRAAA